MPNHFVETFTMLERRISLFLALLFAKLEQIAIHPTSHRKARSAAG